jgi:hypothetical protein
MSNRRIGSGLKMLAAGLLLGGLVLRKSRVPEPVVAKIAEPAPKPKRKRDFLTNNAVIAGIVSAVVAGGISFGVAHYQSQDSARQAQGALQTQQAQKLEGVTLAVYHSLNNVYNFQLKCFDGDMTWRQCASASPDFNSFSTDLTALGADGLNITDKTASGLATSAASSYVCPVDDTA